jgi:hypothetical protein
MLALLIIGIVLLVVAYFAPLPHPLNVVCNILGWICTIIGALLLVLLLVGHPIYY